jgi:hypothetical protein
MLIMHLKRMTIPLSFNIYYQVISHLNRSDLYGMTLSAALSFVQELLHTPSTKSSQSASVKASSNKELSHSQSWQKTDLVAMKDFNVADIRSEFNCSKAE